MAQGVSRTLQAPHCVGGFVTEPCKPPTPVGGAVTACPRTAWLSRDLTPACGGGFLACKPPTPVGGAVTACPHRLAQP